MLSIDPGLAIALSVGLHVLWNLLARSSGDAPGFMWWALLGHGLITAPLLGMLLVHWPPGLLPWLAISTAAIVGYILCLGRAYDLAPAGVVYPVARCSPLPIAFAAWAWSGHQPSPLGWGGILVGVCGLWLLARSTGTFDRRGLPWALGAAACTTVYAISDREAAQILDGLAGAVGFVTAIYSTTALVLFAWRRARGRGLPRRPPWWRLLAGSLCIGSAYALVIHALRRIPPAEAVTYTNAGIVIAVLLGIAVLGERQHWTRRLIATVVITTGLVLLGLAQV